MTTIGQLVSELYAKYERRYRDEELAAIATKNAVEQILQRRAKRLT